MSLESGNVPSDSADGDRDAIIEAAYGCLAEPHTGSVSIAAILSRARLSTRAFYRHFDSKDVLFLAMLRIEGNRVIGRLDRIATDFAGTPVEQLRAWIGEVLDVARDPQLRMHATVLDSDEVRAAKGYWEARLHWHAEGQRSLAAILRRGRQNGSFPLAKPEDDAVAIGALVAYELTRHRDGDPQLWQRVLDRVLDFTSRAIGVPGAR